MDRIIGATAQDITNKSRKIGFIIRAPFHFYIFKNIAKYLPDGEFIFGRGLGTVSYDEPPESQKERINRIFSLITEAGFQYRIFDGRPKGGAAKKFLGAYSAIVSATAEPVIIGNPVPGVKKIRLQYGQSKDFYEFGIRNRHFDMILAQGPYSSKHFSVFASSPEVGFPKFDDWFNGEIDSSLVERILSLVDQSKKTVLYLPTGGALSSANCASEIEKLSNQYNVLVKFHHSTVYANPETIEKYKNSNFAGVFLDDADILPLLKIADTVLTDASGAMFDALLAEKPVVILDIPIASEPAKDVYEKFGFSAKEFGRMDTYEGSIEQVLKKEEFRMGPIVRDVKKLASAIERARDDFIKFAERRAEWKNKLFSGCDGRDGQRAALAIKRCIDEDLEPTFFSKMLCNEIDLMEKKISHLERRLGTAMWINRLAKFFRI